jgi:hypothetical protein
MGGLPPRGMSSYTEALGFAENQRYIIPEAIAERMPRELTKKPALLVFLANMLPFPLILLSSETMFWFCSVCQPRIRARLYFHQLPA